MARTSKKNATPDEHYFFTSESVSMGHPDKVSDAVSDAVLDSLLTHDNRARVACETFCTTGLVVVGGEITVHNQKAVAALNNAEFTIRDTIRKIGYTDDIGMKFDADTCGVMRVMHSQSADIAQGVDEGAGVDKEQGAGDQGLMFGFRLPRNQPTSCPCPSTSATSWSPSTPRSARPTRPSRACVPTPRAR